MAATSKRNGNIVQYNYLQEEWEEKTYLGLYLRMED
jgi:hypothetical protein